MSNHPSGSWHVPINRQHQDSTSPMVNHHTGPSEGQENPGGFSNQWPSHLFLEWDKSFLLQPCMGTLEASVIFMLAWCVSSSVCRSAGKRIPSPTRSWVKKVWRKVRKSKGQWLQLTVSFDLCDSTHWSPSAPLPRLAFLPSPSKPRTTHRNLWKQKIHPQVPMVEPYNWTLEAGQHSPWTSVSYDISGTIFYLRYPKWGAEPGDLICPYCLISCYLTVVEQDRYLIHLWTVKNMLMLTTYQENKGTFCHDCTYLQLQSSYRPPKKSRRMSSSE